MAPEIDVRTVGRCSAIDKPKHCGEISLWIMSGAVESEPARLRICVRGAVQGVGFRPFVYRLALELSLCGWVNNSPQGVFIELEGPRTQLANFLLRLDSEKPPRS